MSSLLLRRRSTALAWGAAAVTAAALYSVVPVAYFTFGNAAWAPLLGVDLAVLAAYAIRVASPLVVLGLIVVTAALALVVDFAAAFAESCGESHTGGIVKAVGVYSILVILGGTGLARRGRLVLLVPGAVVVCGVWVAVISHLVPGWSGGCFE